MTRRWARLRRLIMHTVLHADDTPHRLALGAALGTFIAFLPIVGVQSLFALFLAAVLRVNKALAVLAVWITNPATVLPIYSACYLLGRFILRRPAGESDLQQLKHLVSQLFAADGLSRFATLAFWREVLHIMGQLSAELWVGCAFAGVIGGGIAYIVTRRVVTAFRARHTRFRANRRAERKAARELRAARAAAAAGPAKPGRPKSTPIV